VRKSSCGRVNGHAAEPAPRPCGVAALYARSRVCCPAMRWMALARYSGDWAPVTMRLPPKMKHGTPSMPASLALFASFSTRSTSASLARSRRDAGMVEEIWKGLFFYTHANSVGATVSPTPTRTRRAYFSLAAPRRQRSGTLLRSAVCHSLPGDLPRSVRLSRPDVRPAAIADTVGAKVRGKSGGQLPVPTSPSRPTVLNLLKPFAWFWCCHEKQFLMKMTRTASIPFRYPVGWCICAGSPPDFGGILASETRSAQRPDDRRRDSAGDR
jgi:hypothetical protein